MIRSHLGKFKHRNLRYQMLYLIIHLTIFDRIENSAVDASGISPLAMNGRLTIGKIGGSLRGETETRTRRFFGGFC